MYIKELKAVDNKIIHNWGDLEKLKKNNINIKDIKYPLPILDYSKEKNNSLKIFKAIHR
jgi:deoxyribodipyrimidine photolyase